MHIMNFEFNVQVAKELEEHAVSTGRQIAHDPRILQDQDVQVTSTIMMTCFFMESLNANLK